MDGHVEVDGNVIRAEFVMKPWIKNTYLKFVEDRLVVVSRNEGMMKKMISKHRPWISKHYNEIKSCIRLFDSDSIFYRSRRYNVNYIRSGSRPKVDISESGLLVYAPSQAAASMAIERMIKADSLRLSEEIATRKAVQINESLSGIKVRKCRKWGVCKSNRMITLNYAISMLPERLLDYVISHEVAHLKEMNHSAKFWSVVSKLCPEYKKHRKELKNYDSASGRLRLVENEV
ncbi:MAG: M48 family metallopeptidase [Candidatus Micrarchaeaceae archaeon]